MDSNLVIAPKRQITPTIYAYVTPTNTAKEGWIKIGYTDRDADLRIKEQTHTVGIEAQKLWSYEARFNGGRYFDDRAFHAFLAKNRIVREKGTEWFYFNGSPEQAKALYRDFVFKDYSSIQQGQKVEYQLRSEQAEAVAKTLAYIKKNTTSEFLWNAKPRFGKTLTTYDFIRNLDAQNVLIVTNRPAIANEWYDEFEKFISWQTDYKFVSESDSLKDRPTMSREEYKNHLLENENARQVAFLSLQDLKGSKYFGGVFDKLQWVTTIPWDVLVIDEAHEGVDTFKTDTAFEQIKRNFTLHLSGTPFKAIAKGRFIDEQIFNWSYEDEQEAKSSWEGEENNPYEKLPRLNMFTYQMSKMIMDEVDKGSQIDGDNVDYAFDLNEFFATKDEDGKFKYEVDVKKWLDTLTRNEKYPFSTPALRDELKHTFWLLNRVASAKALAALLKEHPVFENYEIIIAAGDGKAESEDITANETSLKKVREAIANSDKTITLSVGQLTTGVTIPEWTAVMMLSNLKSPSLYMQAAFRAQNPNTWSEGVAETEKLYQKENAYVFDFAPERTLIIFDEFANNLSSQTAGGGGTSQDREHNIRRLLNFFPVIGEDSEGKMVELDATQVLTIPRVIKATEVVKRGFMSNLLFANISGIFQAPQAALDILNHLSNESQGKVKKPKTDLEKHETALDENGEVIIDREMVVNKAESIFGNKVFQVEEVLEVSDEPVQNELVFDKIAKKVGKAVVDNLAPELQNVKEEYDLTNASSKKIEKKVEVEVENTVNKLNAEFKIQQSHLEKAFEEKLKNAETDDERKKSKDNFDIEFNAALDTYNQELKDKVAEKVESLKTEIIQEQEQKKKEKEKTTVEEEVRGRLRGFARTIPSFIMAYGDEGLSLANFDSYTPKEVFLGVTGITIDQFVFLRDGGEYEEDGIKHHFEGKLFDEIVFNESVQEFLRKKRQLSNYFEDNEEDIFDYIPPQKTNQICTPKNIVKMMVDSLEGENPGIFDDKSKTFADLYMKSGLYITEIVKRLYNSPTIQKEIPIDNERIKHILENQVYGFAPSEIIYNIATNFIFGNLDQSINRTNFVMEDTAPYAKEGKLQELVDLKFGE